MHFPAGKHLHEQKTSGSINYSVTSFWQTTPKSATN
jgi:hypothetical protein